MNFRENMLSKKSYKYPISNLNYRIIMSYKKLSPEEEAVIVNKGTEMPFTGKFVHHKDDGIYICKRCEKALFYSQDKFESSCGWPSFDESIPEAIRYEPDRDGIRTEILCKNCHAHLGHIFEGEGFTEKNKRYCVNSISMEFVESSQLETAYFASGCFWGTQHHFDLQDGVLYSRVGFMGGHLDRPTYKEVCTGQTGHAEVLEVIFDKSRCNYEILVKLFFETHDFTQINRQGPDVGTQYRSVVFYQDENQKAIAEKYLDILKQKDFIPATAVEASTTFWLAEDYHQHYYRKTGGKPYCHVYRKIF